MNINIPVIFQNTCFGLLHFPFLSRLKIRNRVDYYSSLNGLGTKKSSRPKPRILEDHGYKGFTLIEILIALTVFAILATITSSTLYYAFTTRERVSNQAERLNELQLAVSILQQDTSQSSARAIRGNEMRLFPVFVGQSQYLELTRDGVINPMSIEKRSTLKRIALVCLDDALVRRTWSSLDPLDRNSYHDKKLIGNLKECSFKYLNQNNDALSEWHAEALTQSQQKEPFPRAIQLNIILNDWGALNLLFIIPEGLYASA